MIRRFLVSLCSGAFWFAGCSEPSSPSSCSTPSSCASPSEETVRFFQGWMAVTGERTGSLIETEHAVLPSTCDGELSTADDSPGFIYADWSRFGSPEGDVPDHVLTPRPDLERPPGPLYRVSVDGKLRGTEARLGFTREMELLDPNGTTIVYLDVCSTVLERGACYIPSPEYNFLCLEVPGSNGGLQSRYGAHPALRRNDDRWLATFRSSVECMEEIPAEDHPEDLPLKEQQIEITWGDLPEGQVVPLDPSTLRWRSSYIVERECIDLIDAGEECTCTFGAREISDLERGWILLHEGSVYLEVKTRGEDPLYVWGRFDVEP